MFYLLDELFNHYYLNSATRKIQNKWNGVCIIELLIQNIRLLFVL